MYVKSTWIKQQSLPKISLKGKNYNRLFRSISVAFYMDPMISCRSWVVEPALVLEGPPSMDSVMSESPQSPQNSIVTSGKHTKKNMENHLYNGKPHYI